MRDNQQRKFYVKIFSGNQSTITTEINNYLHEHWKEKFILKDTQSLQQDNNYIVLILFEYHHLKFHFSSNIQPKISIFSNQDTSCLENRLNQTIAEKQTENYYPTHINLLTEHSADHSADHSRKISALVVFEHSNLLENPS